MVALPLRIGEEESSSSVVELRHIQSMVRSRQVQDSLYGESIDVPDRHYRPLESVRESTFDNSNHVGAKRNPL